MTIIDAEIFHKTLVKAPMEKVYDCFATSSGLDSWFTKGSIVDISRGEMKFVWKDWGPLRDGFTK